MPQHYASQNIVATMLATIFKLFCLLLRCISLFGNWCTAPTVEGDKLFVQLDQFITLYRSTGTESTYDARECSMRKVVSYQTLGYVLGLVSLMLVEPLSTHHWQVLVSNVNKKHTSCPKKSNARTRLLRILQACCLGTRYSVVYESAHVHDNGIISIHGFGFYIESRKVFHMVVVPHKKEGLFHAQRQSDGYEAECMRDWLELGGVVNKDTRIRSVALACDGLDLSISVLRVIGTNFVVSRCASHIPLWGKAMYFKEETLGVRLLRTLLHCDPEQLFLHTRPQSFLLSDGRVARAQRVLGQGAFCTAFACSVLGEDRPVCVKRPIFATVERYSFYDQVAQLCHEWRALKRLSGCRCASLPRLYSADDYPWPGQAFLATVPVGLGLIPYAATLTKRARVRAAEQLREALKAALQAAHSIDVCHGDLRPDNIVRSDSTFVIIDWGLSVAPGDPVHRYRGVREFLADEILLAEELQVPCTYAKEYDYESARCTLYAFVHGDGNLVPERWMRLDAELLISTRSKDIAGAGGIIGDL